MAWSYLTEPCGDRNLTLFNCGRVGEAQGETSTKQSEAVAGSDSPPGPDAFNTTHIYDYLSHAVTSPDSDDADEIVDVRSRLGQHRRVQSAGRSDTNCLMLCLCNPKRTTNEIVLQSSRLTSRPFLQSQLRIRHRRRTQSAEPQCRGAR